MDAELLESIRSHLASHRGVSLLPQDEADALRVLVAEHHGFSLSATWWWENLSVPTRKFEYGSVEEGLELLLRVLPDHAGMLSLFITDDEPAPWPCVRGTASDLFRLLREQRIFEYVVVGPNRAWLLFDTHHNVLIGVGSAFS